MRSTHLFSAILLAIVCSLCSSFVMAKNTSSVSKHTSHHSASKKYYHSSSSKKKHIATTTKHKTTKHKTTKHKTTKHKTTKHKTTKHSATKIYGKHRLIAYVVDWEVPSTISWSKFDHVAYAFAEPDANGALKSFTDSVLKKCKLISLCYNIIDHLTAFY